MKCDICGEPATKFSLCYNYACPSTADFHFCDGHFNPELTCLFCGTVFDSDDLDAEDELPIPPILGIAANNLMLDDEEDEPKLLNLDELVGSCGTGKVVHTEEMAVTVKVCNGFEMTDVVLGHSFHEMRAAELSIRKQCGISVSGGMAKGINIALMELRLLLVDKECNVYEIGVQLCDGFGRNMLLCSTGGVVLTEETEITRLEQLQTKEAASAQEILVLSELKKRKSGGDKLVRCCASSAPYGGTQLFAMCGGYSFFKSGGKTGEELKIAASGYEQMHDGKYRKWVQGSAHDQLFHHSEQTGFKMLFENPNLLVRVLKRAFDTNFLPDIAVSLKAISIDIFTTRSACGGCMRCAVCVLSSGHIFDILLQKVKEAEFAEPIICNSVRKMVRFDCAALFDGLHKIDPPKDCVIIHGTPRTKQGLVPKPHEAFTIFRLPVICNAKDNILLDSGSQKQFLPEILRKIKEDMNIINIPPLLKGMSSLFWTFMQRYTSDPYSGVVAGSFLVNKFIASSGSGAMKWHLQETARQLKIEVDEETIKLAEKYYYFLQFFEEDISGNLLKCALVGCGSYYFGASVFEKTFRIAFKLAFALAFKKDLDEEGLGVLINKIKGIICAVIKSLLEMDNPMAENTARLLALHYDVLNEYRKLLE